MRCRATASGEPAVRCGRRRGAATVCVYDYVARAACGLAVILVQVAGRIRFGSPTTRTARRRSRALWPVTGTGPPAGGVSPCPWASPRPPSRGAPRAQPPPEPRPTHPARLPGGSQYPDAEGPGGGPAPGPHGHDRGPAPGGAPVGEFGLRLAVASLEPPASLGVRSGETKDKLFYVAVDADGRGVVASRMSCADQWSSQRVRAVSVYTCPTAGNESISRGGVAKPPKLKRFEHSCLTWALRRSPSSLSAPF